MKQYIESEGTFIHEGMSIPADPGNRHYIQVLAEVAAGEAVIVQPPEPTPEEVAADLQQSIVSAAQDRLDAFARTRNYDSILSAATYATSTVERFAAEGQRAVELRDEMWAALYQILAEVQSGNRPIPEGFGDIEAGLPELDWDAS